VLVARAEPAAGATAPSVAVAASPGDEATGDADDETAPSSAPPAATAAAAADVPAVAAPDARAAAPAQKPGGSSVYLTDKELHDAQSATDDGEVEE